MVLITTRIILTIPLGRTTALRPEKPKRIRSRMKPLPINHPSRQTNITLSGPLVKITLLCRLKPPRILKNHLRNRSDIHKIQAFTPDPVHSHIPHHQHPKFTLTLCLSPHQPGEQLNIFLSVLDNSQVSKHLFSDDLSMMKSIS